MASQETNWENSEVACEATQDESRITRLDWPNEPGELNVLCVGDMHIRTDNIPDIKRLGDSLVELITARKVDVLVFMGDQMHYHNKIDSHCFMHFNQMATRINELCRLVIIIGNHDMIYASMVESTAHVYGPFKKWQNTVVADVVCSDVYGQGEDRIKLTYCPYVPPGSLVPLIDAKMGSSWKSGGDEGKSIFFMHQELKGVWMGKKKSVSGDEWDPSWPDAYCGHVHAYCQLQTNVLYVGIPLEHDYTCSKNNSSVSLLTFRSGVEKQTEERIFLSNTRMVRKTINAREIDSGTLSDFRKINSYLSLNPKNKYHLVVNCTSASERDTMNKLLKGVVQDDSIPIFKFRSQIVQTKQRFPIQEKKFDGMSTTPSDNFMTHMKDAFAKDPSIEKLYKSLVGSKKPEHTIT